MDNGSGGGRRGIRISTDIIRNVVPFYRNPNFDNYIHDTMLDVLIMSVDHPYMWGDLFISCLDDMMGPALEELDLCPLLLANHYVSYAVDYISKAFKSVYGTSFNRLELATGLMCGDKGVILAWT